MSRGFAAAWQHGGHDRRARQPRGQTHEKNLAAAPFCRGGGLGRGGAEGTVVRRPRWPGPISICHALSSRGPMPPPSHPPRHLEICRSCSACACTRVRLCVCVCVCVCCVWSWGALPAQTPRNYTVHLSPGSTPHVCRALTHPACQPRRAHRQWRSTGCWSSAGSTVGRPVHFCARSSIGLSCVCTPT